MIYHWCDITLHKLSECNPRGSLTLSLDTILNVFIAIAVDNLAKAQELTAAEEQENKTEQNAAVHYRPIYM